MKHSNQSFLTLGILSVILMILGINCEVTPRVVHTSESSEKAKLGSALSYVSPRTLSVSAILNLDYPKFRASAGD